MQPPDTHADLLERPVFAHYATVRADGAPQVNPMWFLWDPAVGVIRMTHTKARHNYRNVLREPRARAGEKADVARRNTKRRRNKPDERRIGLALARRGAHAHSQHAASVGQLRDPVDGIAATTGREPDEDEEAVRLDAPRRLAHSGEYLDVQPDDKLIEKHEADDENDW